MCSLEKEGGLFVLTLTGDDQHRFNPTLINTIITTLRQVKTQAADARGCALITVSKGRFFSNGFDLAWAQSNSGGSKSKSMELLQQMVDLFKPVVAELISFPMPTVAAVNGHAAAAGLMLALGHDYVLMRSDKGVLYMSEVDLGLPLPDYFTALVRAKVGSASARRDLLLGGRKMKGEEAVRAGIVDSAHDSEAALVEATMSVGEGLAKRKWDGGIYKEIRMSMYPELCGVLGLACQSPVRSKL